MIQLLQITVAGKLTTRAQDSAREVAFSNLGCAMAALGEPSVVARGGLLDEPSAECYLGRGCWCTRLLVARSVALYRATYWESPLRKGRGKR
jgi:hypothetical protein